MFLAERIDCRDHYIPIERLKTAYFITKAVTKRESITMNTELSFSIACNVFGQLVSKSFLIASALNENFMKE